MGWERKVALLTAALAVSVTIAMCVGLSGDEPKPRTSRPSPSEPEWPADPEPELDPSIAADGEISPEEADEPAGEEQALEGERTLVGTVANRRDELLEGAEVWVEGFSRLRDITDSAGRYELRSVPNEASTLLVEVTGYQQKRLELVPAEPDSRQRLDVQLEDGNGVGGSVIDPEGHPVQNARVGCAGRSRSDLEAETDRYGRFALPPHAAGCDGVARHPDHADSPRVELRKGAGNLIALALMGSISGVVVDGQGHPVRSFTLELAEFRPAGDAPSRRRYRQPYANPRGRFAVRDLAAGTYVFRVSPQSGGAVSTGPIVVKSGEQVSDVRVVVR